MLNLCMMVVVIAVPNVFFKTTLKEHVNSVHEVISVYYNCDQCDYQAKRQRDPKPHAESIHDGIYYSCTQYVYKAKGRTSLTEHVNYVHDGIFDYCNCDQCNYKAKRQR